MTTYYDIAIIGATGAVGEVLLKILEEREFPVNELYLLASPRSAGKKIQFKDKMYTVKSVEDFDFSTVRFSFFSAGSAVSKQYVPRAAEAGSIVIDNTSCFRYESDVPLVIPEVNHKDLENYRERNIIANPNCSTIQMLVALKPIYDAAGITRINVATYQSVSGAGRRAIEELAQQTTALLNAQEPLFDAFPQQIAFNVLPHIGDFQDNGYTLEEMKMIWETQKILHDHEILVNPTTVRVPVFYGHSEAIHCETRQPISIEEVKAILKQAPGVVLMEENEYPTAFHHAAHNDEVFVGRVRQDLSHPQGINLWVVADNIRKGAALNTIQIAEHLIGKHF